MRIITAIIDKVTNEIIGQMLVLHKHNVPALRMFDDAMRQSPMMQQHPADHELWQLGTMNDDNEITPDAKCIQSGESWFAAQPRDEENKNARV